MEHWGFCTGIENYSRHLTGRHPNEAPPVLIDYFPDDFLCIVDESHLTIPQVGAMFRGDRARKETLVRHGFRLPSALGSLKPCLTRVSLRALSPLNIAPT